MPVIVLSIVDKKNVGFALGATGYLIMPISKPQLLETMHKHVSPQVDDDSVILLVDDDPRTLELLEDTLRSAGYETRNDLEDIHRARSYGVNATNSGLLRRAVPRGALSLRFQRAVRAASSR